jgi:flavin-dependent dehydrogenase
MFDVAIVGAGPAGSACALALRAHAPSLSIALIESSHFDAPRLGETLPPAARTLLEHLGVFDTFRASGHREVHGTAAAWGAPQAYDNDFLFFARGAGWHLDRAAFDAMLAREAEVRGVTLMAGTAVREARRVDGKWLLECPAPSAQRPVPSAQRPVPSAQRPDEDSPGHWALGAGRWNARFLVDATGNAALATRACGARFVAIDHLVSFTRFYDEAGEGDPRTLVEAFDDGWWYTAALPSGGRVIACMTDADIARQMRLSETESWCRALDAMPLIGAIARNAAGGGPIVARSTESRRLAPAAGDDWLAVGDAASRFDPLSSQGITKALRGGIFAAYAIGDLIERHDDRGLRAYDRFICAEFEAYDQARARQYGDERRWMQNEFWKRRSGPVCVASSS